MAVVFAKSGYNNRGSGAVIQIDYVGNCIDYPILEYPDHNNITNSNTIILIDNQEFERIESKEGQDLDAFELIAADVKQIKVRGQSIPFQSNHKEYEKVGVKVRAYDNPKNLVGFGDFVRYLN